jgi:hypothetical protein
VASPVAIKLPGQKQLELERFDWFEAEILLDDKQLHQESGPGPREYHNAYDADENFNLIRVDALFTVDKTEYQVPVVAIKDQAGTWKWVVRFRPHVAGSWRMRVRALVWHPKALPNEPKAAKRTSSSNRTEYYEHAFGFSEKDYGKKSDAEVFFKVKNATRNGPLSVAEDYENRNYLHRWVVRDGKYRRQPVFVLGCCRAWVAEDAAWESGIDREKDLFTPLKDAGGHVLYHWMAPWESQLAHQSPVEHWSQPSGKILELPSFPPTGGAPANLSAPLSGADMALAYKRLDQGRAKHTDEILRQAERKDIELFVVVMPHPNLQDTAHGWKQHYWNPAGADYSRYNGFRFFKGAMSAPIEIAEFFQADPSGKAGAWSRQLFKHWANYWRYVIGRWTAMPGLGAWVLMDELEGVGTGTDFWWKNRASTYPWHDNLVKLLRSQLLWKWEGKELPYTGDYLEHPFTSSATSYAQPGGQLSNQAGDAEIMKAVADVQELRDRADWNGDRHGLSFFSHHAYHFVPVQGMWTGPPGKRVYKKTGASGQLQWKLSNTDDAETINTDRWLWDALCQRLVSYSSKVLGGPRLITEFGARDRKEYETQVDWEHYGKRSPTLAHFGNWAALALGLAGNCFKWNDGRGFGEMAPRPPSTRPNTLWTKTKYPPDCYKELRNLNAFVKNLDFSRLKERRKAEVADEKGALLPEFAVFTLSADDLSTLVVWLYDRSFKSRGQAKRRQLKLDITVAQRTFQYELFDTWNGQPIKSAVTEGTTDDFGILVVELPATFPTSSEDASKGIADGNDIAVRLTERQKAP